MMPTRMRVWVTALLSFPLAAAIIGVIPAAGTTVVRLDIAELSQMAALVVEGEVIETSSAWNQERTQIHTYVTFNVTDVYAGKATLGRMEFRLLGGVAGDIAWLIPGAPGFVEGEHLVLFLHDNPRFFTPVVGLNHGKLSFLVDPETGEEIVGNQLVGFFDKPELKSLVVKARERR